MEQKSNRENRHVSFAAIDQYVESNLVLPTERRNTGKDFVEWGDRNSYPDFLLGLYNDATTLRSIINGNVDFIVGDDVAILPLDGKFIGGIMNAKGDTIVEQVKDLARDKEIYGGFALQVIRSLDGSIAEIHHIDMRFLRMNKDCNVFYYSEKWGEGGRKKVIVYPAFMPNLKWETLSDEEKDRHASSILFAKDIRTQVYPAPVYGAKSSIIACQIESAVSEYHWNSLNTDFCPPAIINFNNGDPGDEIKEEIMEDLEEKFSGYQNGKRFMASWNKDKGSAVTIETIHTDDFSERYKALIESSRRQIFTAFRAIPLLFGLTSEANTGFSTDEFEQSFKLYNRTHIRPIQRMICDAYDKIYGMKGVLTISPFQLETSTETEVH